MGKKGKNNNKNLHFTKNENVSKKASNSVNLKHPLPLSLPPIKDKKKWSDHPLYILFTIIVTVLAAVGGIPGIKSWFSEKPELKFRPTTISLFEAKTLNPSIYNTGQRTFVLLSGILYNNKPKPLYVDNNGFDFEVTLPNGENVKPITPAMLPKNLPIFDAAKKMIFTNITDLQIEDRIEQDNPLKGHFAFYLKQDLDSIGHLFINNKTLLKIICTDISGKRYEDTFHFNFVKLDHNFVLPKLGIDFHIQPIDSVIH